MYKGNLDAMLGRYEQFWTRTNTDRVILNLSAPTAPAFRGHTSLEEKWLDADYICEQFKYNTEHTFFAAEGVPMLFTNLGPGCFSACIGGPYALAENTIWFDGAPPVKSWENPPPLSFDQGSEMWQHVVRLQDRFAKEGFHFSITDLGGIMDIVSSLRGAETLLYDLYDYPEEVRAYTKEVKDLWFEGFQKQVETIRQTGQPYNNWMNIPSAKPWYPIQCDFCAMISPTHFEEFVLEDLAEQADRIDRTIYHLDGKGELPHLDMILDIPSLTGVQWVPGDGQPQHWDEQWFRIYRKIQDKKKNLVLTGGLSDRDMAGAERLIKSIDPKGVCISADCSSPDGAKRLLENVERWSE